MNKIYKPGECMKYMAVEMHPSLLDAWFCADVRRELSAAGARAASAADVCDQRLVLWTRTIPPGTAQEQPSVMPKKERCERALYVMQAEEVAEKVSERALAAHVAEVQDLVGCSVTLLVFQAQEYYRTTGRKTKNSSRKLMTEMDLEMAITDLLVTSDWDTILVNTPNELALVIVQFTKALAEAPYKKAKRQCDEQLEFYMRGENKKCVALDKDGNGKSRLWQQMIAVLPMSSLETSRALCAKYKTPRALYEESQSPNNVKKIADIGVARAAVPGARARRIGPEFAKKLQILFSAEDGNMLLD